MFITAPSGTSSGIFVVWFFKNLMICLLVCLLLGSCMKCFVSVGYFLMKSRIVVVKLLRFLKIM